MSARTILTDAFLWLGVALVVVSCVGVLVMRGALERLHFSGPAVLGAVFVAVAVLIKDSFSVIGDQALLIAAFLLLASPILTHAAARATRVDAKGDWRLRPEDEVEIEEP